MSIFLWNEYLTGYVVYLYYQDDKKQEDRFDQLKKIEEERDKNPVSCRPDWLVED